MENNELDETGRRFLVELYAQTDGKPAVQVSMYDIGATVGLDRAGSSQVAQDLIGTGLVVIKTLSGGIGISDDGAQAVRALTGGPDLPGGMLAALGDDPVLDPAGCQALEQVTADLKSAAGSLGLEFEALAELMADLKTIDAQLGSSRPKTAILRACLQSIKAGLEKSGESENRARVAVLLGET